MRTELVLIYNYQDRVECIEHVGTNKECENQGISKGKFKKVGEDVEVLN